jgi:hypothetical protein
MTMPACGACGAAVLWLQKNPAVVVPIEELRLAVMHALDFVSPVPFLNYTIASEARRS